MQLLDGHHILHVFETINYLLDGHHILHDHLFGTNATYVRSINICLEKGIVSSPNF